MKEFVIIHDYLVSEAVVGDWDGQEEEVAEKVNEFYHTLYDLADENIEVDVLHQLLDVIWDNWIGHEDLPNIESEDIYDWCRNLLENKEQYLQN